MSLGIGVDFGTVCSTLAYYDGNIATVLADIPSSLKLVQHGAKTTILLAQWDKLDGSSRKSYIMAVKQLFEHHCLQTWDISRQMDWFLDMSQFQVGDSWPGDIKVWLGNQQYTPEEICTHFLHQLKAEAESCWGDKVERCAIGVPACSTPAYHQLLRQCALKAGFGIAETVSELESASMDLMRFLLNEERYILIFDMGGSRAQVAVLRFEDQAPHILAEGRDDNLGGCHLDAYLMHHIAGEIGREGQNNPLAQSPAFRARVARAREELSREQTTQVKLDGAEEYKLSRGPVERVFAKDESKIHALVEQSLTEARLKDEQIERVFLIGGLAHTPALQKIFHRRFGNKVRVTDSPQHCVARGCAVWFYRWQSNLIVEPITSNRQLGSQVDDLIIGFSQFSLINRSANYFPGFALTHLSAIFAHPLSISAEGGAYIDSGTCINCRMRRCSGESSVTWYQI